MSCLDVMCHHQVYGMHQYLPSTAAACTTAYYHHHNQQKKITACSKMQEAVEVSSPTKQEDDEKDQPAEMEYLNSRCVLFTYFQGDIGAVVDEHFSRALSQISSINPQNTTSKTKIATNSLWRDSSSISCQMTGFPPSLWTNSYQPPAPTCLSGVHPDFPTTATGTFSSTEHNSWPGDSVHQTVPPPHSAESWHYPLAAQTSSPYAHMHDVYMYHHHAHPHMHHHHHHHRHPSTHLGPRYGPLLMPSVRATRISAPQCDGTKSDPATAITGTTALAGTFHGTVDIIPSFGFEAGLQQDKGKESPWF
ncbi:transcription cofactor vestigial-like protein 3 [Bombina bombina]|uniref:transcription cofactor vestigial-like protein 3 n=1 Tax=Bombina bombina TaxID=8345 RepID=UPI00235AE50A|nr:transcription cofactor vestigial-like protein 3 [Bombina bombina]